ncbi:MAG: prepilin-type N-terminal cleavage/methylation domain-containing protein [Candidatus Paceibacterota bacterium]
MNKAFTLIELLVVIVIVGILASIIIVSTINAQNSANDAKRKADINQISKAILMYKIGNPNTSLGISSGCEIGGDCGAINVIFGEAVTFRDPKGSYYTYYSSDGIDFNIFAILSTEKVFGYSSIDSYYTSVMARSSAYNSLNKFWVISPPSPPMANVDDSANGALFGQVSSFSAGWTSYVKINAANGFEAGNYDIYVRARTDGSGSNPTSLPFKIYDRDTENLQEWTVNDLSTSYQVKYVGRYTLQQADINKIHIDSSFSSGEVTTNYFVDFLEFRPVP